MMNVFDNKTLFFIFLLIQTQCFYCYIVELYRNIVQDILKKEYDFMGGFMGGFLVNLNFN